MTSLNVHDITDMESLPFSSKEYSLFKFGSKSIANKFGKHLFYKFRSYLIATYGPIHMDSPKIPQIVVCSAPYNHIPTATGAMKDYFVKYLNEWLADLNIPVVQETKVHRDTTYREDYGSMSKEQRLSLIGGDRFHIDGSFLENKLVLFIDDVHITGAHELMMRKMLIKCAHSLHFNHMFLYFAKLTNPDTCPTIENELNFASMDGVFALYNLINADDFLFNTRVVKYILNCKGKDITTFLSWQTKTFLDTLYHLAIGNSYHLVPEYQENLVLVKDLLDENSA